MITAKVKITLKKGILDPEGRTILNALKSLGIDGIENVNVGKYMELKFNNLPVEKVRELTELSCRKLLANPVIEDYSFEIEERS